MTTKKAPKTKKGTKRRTGRTTAQLRREVFHNFVLEVLLANVLAELDPRGAGTVVQQVSTLDGCVLERDREMQRIAGHFMARVVERLEKIRLERGQATRH